MLTPQDLQRVVDQINQKFKELDEQYLELESKIKGVEDAIRKGNLRKSTGKTTKKAEE